MSQSYGDSKPHILTTLAKHDEVIWGYQRESKAVEGSVADHLKMSKHTTAKCFSAVETVTKHYTTVTSRLDAWDQSNATSMEPVTVVPPPVSTATPITEPRPAEFTRPWGRHPVHPVVVVFFLCPTTDPTVASIIRSLVQTLSKKKCFSNALRHTLVVLEMH